jgi:galactokinase
MTDLLSYTISRFQEHFDEAPEKAAYAPGRVEILGNHTDYNGGYVMSAAIDKGTVLVGSLDEFDQISLLATDLNRNAEFNVNLFERDARSTWANYVLGVVQQLQRSDINVRGFKAAIHSIIPLGAGLSSSAALEVASAYLLKQLFPFELSKMDVALLCQRAENQFVGVSSGLLDQFSSVFGAPNHLMFLDCRTLENAQLRLPREDLSLVICDSLAKHSLVGGEYNTRRAECMAASAFFGKELLRDVTIDEFNARKSELPDNQRKRAQHVIEENERVLQARQALVAGDAKLLGELMTASHQSSRYLFENSVPELDFLVDTARELPGCLGARLTGGGWGGATINLVEDAFVDQFSAALSEKYFEHSGRRAPVFVSTISDGAHFVSVK